MRETRQTVRPTRSTSGMSRPYLGGVVVAACWVCFIAPARSVEWHCARVGTGNELRGKVLSDDFCFQVLSSIAHALCLCCLSLPHLRSHPYDRSLCLSCLSPFPTAFSSWSSTSQMSARTNGRTAATARASSANARLRRYSHQIAWSRATFAPGGTRRCEMAQGQTGRHNQLPGSAALIRLA